MRLLGNRNLCRGRLWLSFRHLAFDRTNYHGERQHQPYRKRQSEQPPVHVVHRPAPINLAITQATAEPATKASRYHNHWITKSMLDSP
jgi:hypothetical protein